MNSTSITPITPITPQTAWSDTVKNTRKHTAYVVERSKGGADISSRMQTVLAEAERRGLEIALVDPVARK